MQVRVMNFDTIVVDGDMLEGAAAQLIQRLGAEHAYARWTEVIVKRFIEALPTVADDLLEKIAREHLQERLMKDAYPKEG